MYGDLKLAHAIGLKASLHRALLMMGIEKSHRAKGLGSALMREALSWARQHPTLEWVQLNVFAYNEPAKALYRRFGFKEIGTNMDLFRALKTLTPVQLLIFAKKFSLDGERRVVFTPRINKTTENDGLARQIGHRLCLTLHRQSIYSKIDFM